MAVSLRKPSKVDLSKPPLHESDPPESFLDDYLSPQREITPEHILEEHIPHKEISITPIHTATEVIPHKEISITPIHTAAEVIPREECSSESKPQVKSGGVDDFLQYEEFRIHLPRLLIVLLLLLAVFEMTDPFAACFEVVQMTFEFFSSNSLVLALLSICFVLCGFRLIKRLFQNMRY